LISIFRGRFDDEVGVTDGLLDVDVRRDVFESVLGFLIGDPVLLGQFLERPRDLVVPVLDELLLDVP